MSRGSDPGRDGRPGVRLHCDTGRIGYCTGRNRYCIGRNGHYRGCGHCESPTETTPACGHWRHWWLSDRDCDSSDCGDCSDCLLGLVLGARRPAPLCHDATGPIFILRLLSAATAMSDIAASLTVKAFTAPRPPPRAPAEGAHGGGAAHADGHDAAAAAQGPGDISVSGHYRGADIAAATAAGDCRDAYVVKPWKLSSAGDNTDMSTIALS
jgi:hypothetical protein